MLATFSNTAGSAALLGNQVYGPYGTQRYTKGAMGTNKGFTGQYNDSLTGLDYYNARYYDPAAAVFLSVDTKQGNLQGMNPYDYVGGNPETHNDPTGKYFGPPGNGGPPPSCVQLGDCVKVGGGNGDGNNSSPSLTGPSKRLCQLNGGCNRPNGPPSRAVLLELCKESPACIKWEVNQNAQSFWAFFWGAVTVAQVIFDLSHGIAPEVATEQEREQEAEALLAEEETLLTTELEQDGLLTSDGQLIEGCSFTPTTQVATDHGKRPIGTLHIGDKVWSYNVKTHKMELQPILHVWIHSDNDLVDLTIITPTIARNCTSRTAIQSEVVHTNQKHPFLTKEQGFLAVGKIIIGMHILRADGHVGVVTGWKRVPGVTNMYNLEVQQDHTFTVGNGQWVVHNFCSGKDINITPSKLQHTYQHASAFGITGNWNAENGQKFDQAIRDFVDAPSTIALNGTYRGVPVTHYFDPSTHQDVMIDPYNNLVAAWQLSDAQVHYLITIGNVQ